MTKSAKRNRRMRKVEILGLQTRKFRGYAPKPELVLHLLGLLILFVAIYIAVYRYFYSVVLHELSLDYYCR